MATLIPIYEHVAQELSTARWAPTITAHTASSVAAAVRRSDAWPKLTALLRNIELAGLDAKRHLTEAARQGELEAADDPGAVLLGRIASSFNSGRARARPVRLIAGIVVPADEAKDPAARAALDHAATAIRQRAANLVHEAQTTDAPWLAHLSSAAGAGADGEEWRTAATAVATFRDRWGISDDEPLGAQAGSDRTQRRDRARARRAIDALKASREAPAPVITSEDGPAAASPLATDRSIS